MTFDLKAESTNFAQEVQDLLGNVFPPFAGEDPTDRQIKVLLHHDQYVIRTGSTERPGGISLLADGKKVGSLKASFHCGPDRSGQYLAVRKSTFAVSSVQEAVPLLRLDFHHKSHSVPAAHWNIHGERGATSVMLARCNPKHSGLLSQVHLPVGGTRYRPCLEDFAEMLVEEFNVDRILGWKERVHQGRERWRVMQARSVARDCPEAAAAVLEKLGYTVIKPATGHPGPNTDMLRCR